MNTTLYSYLYPRSELLQKKIFSEIEEKGKITFARFMEIVLYDRELGYYFNIDTIYNDYLTSPAVHQSFGFMVAEKMVKLWENMGKPVCFTIVETGAGDGLLCRQIMERISKCHPDFYRTLRYVILSFNEKDTGRLILPDKTDLIIYNEEIPFKNIEGCFLSNELIDAFPVHFITVKNGELMEVFVTVKDGNFTEVLDLPSTEDIKEYVGNISVTLPEGFRGEVNLNSSKWIKKVSSSLKRGYIFTIDYGYEDDELFSKKEGTLNCFYSHSISSNPYKRIGHQDITSHVDFSRLIRQGRGEGLQAEEFMTQRDFLLEIGIEREMGKMDRRIMNLADYNASVNGIERLLDIRGLGNIKVLLQSKCVEG